MSVLRMNKSLLLRVLPTRAFSTAPLPNEDEYTLTPQYPKIQDLSYDKVLERKKQAKYDEIKAVPTIEEKQIKLNMPKYYGFKSYMLHEENIPYNNLNLAQHVTRTHLKRVENLPEFYKDINIDENVLNGVKKEIEEVILYELDGYRRIHDLRKEELNPTQQEDLISTAITRKINRILLNNLSGHFPHLENIQIDLDARIESFWYAGGMHPPTNVVKYREGQKWQSHKIDAPSDRLMAYSGSPSLSLRHAQLLRPFAPHSATDPSLSVPHFEYDPRTVGIATDYKHMANIPGHWPGDPNKCAFLSFHKRGLHLNRAFNDPNDRQEALHRQGILASFAWLHSQANYLGFTTFNDITYPLATQTVLTNGQLFSFYIYQLNTIALYGDNYVNNPQKNVCWASNELKLFESINDGKIVGFNAGVVELLAKLYANRPEVRLGVNLTPYLGKEEQMAADYAHDERREWLEREYKYLVANRPRKHLEYEIYAWEKIYKIDNETRFMEKKRRPFELGVKPWDRRLDDRKPRYIPRKLRPDLPRHKGRNANEYFP